MEKLRLSFLAVIFGSVFLVLGRTILVPTTANSTVTPFIFPTAVPLPEWQPLVSRPLAAPVPENLEYVSGRLYRYIQKNRTLDIEMRYMINTPAGVRFFIRFILPFPGQLTLALQEQEGVGFYYLFVYQQRAYLSTCINPRGGSTVTEFQFQRNRYLYDMHLGRLLAWMLGGTFKDRRCLWAHLSTPLKNSSSENAYRILEQAWFDWYQWWRTRFPQS
jgi:cyanosortase A-associated protein